MKPLGERGLHRCPVLAVGFAVGVVGKLRALLVTLRFRVVRRHCGATVGGATEPAPLVEPFNFWFPPVNSSENERFERQGLILNHFKPAWHHEVFWHSMDPGAVSARLRLHENPHQLL